MIIFIVGNYYDSLLNFRGGLIQKLASKGHSVFAISPKPENRTEPLPKLKEKISKLGGSYIPLNFKRHFANPLNELTSLIKLFLELRDKKPQVIISYTLKPLIFTGICISLNNLFFFKNKIKFFPLITGLGSIFIGSNKTNKLIKFAIKILYKFSLTNSKAIIFQNPDDKNDLCEWNILPKKKKSFRVYGSGVDLYKFKPQPLPTKNVFLMISRLIVDKGVVEFLQAAKIVKKKFPDVIFRLVGPFDNSQISSFPPTLLEEYIKEGILEYKGEIESVINELTNCKYFVLPSYREGTPRSILEAMATQRPIITTDVPGCRETVIEGYNGFLVPCMSVTPLVEAMIKMLKQDFKKSSLMGERSYFLAKKFFDANKVNENIIKIIEK